MKFCLRLLGLLLVLASGQVLAQSQPELAGTWQGKLAVDATTSLTIQFVFTKKPDGTYSAVLNSPDNGAIKNVAAGAVAWSAGALKVDVPTLSGAYAGTLKDGKFDGKWTQQGTVLPLALSPWQKPVLSKAAIETLTGTWNGPLEIPGGGKLTFVYRFKTNDKGELQGILTVPEQGSIELPMSDIEFADNKLFFRVPMVQGEYHATYSGGSLNGNWRQGPQPPPGMAVNLKKGEFAAPVYALKLSTEAFASLNGKWQGKLDTPTPDGKTVSQNVTLRVETNTAGQYVSFFDVQGPAQKVSIPVTEASLAAGKAVLKFGGVGGQFSADLTGKTLKGTVVFGPRTVPLTLTKQ